MEKKKEEKKKKNEKIRQIFGSTLIMIAGELTRTFRDAPLRASSTPYDWRTLVTNNGSD